MFFTFSLYANIWGASRCSRRASRLSHFSIIVTTFSSNICGVSLASISTNGKYSIHPLSSQTFSILALKISRKPERLPVSMLIDAITLIIAFSFLCSRILSTLMKCLSSCHKQRMLTQLDSPFSIRSFNTFPALHAFPTDSPSTR